MIFVILALVILVFVAMFQFDLHKTLFVKTRSRNAGDAAALAAARWQGVSLNLIGDLNVAQAAAILRALEAGSDRSPEAEAMADLTARIAYVGPMMGFIAAQQAAKQNGLYNNPAYGAELAAHANRVRQDYPDLYPPPYGSEDGQPSAWDDYADMLAEAANQGVAVAADNMRLYNDYVNFNHFLLNPSFYDAIAGHDYCWFEHNAGGAEGLLREYTDHTYWDPLPRIQEPEPVNPEIFGLNLRKVNASSSMRLRRGAIEELIDRQIEGTPIDAGGLARFQATWYGFASTYWQSWTDYIPDGFPFRSEIKPHHDVLGADAAVRSETTTDRITPRVDSATITWSAAAKPFGSLGEDTPPHVFGIVLPVFSNAHLIPIDASTAPAGGSRPGWGIHIRYHLPEYVAAGLAGLANDCWYCGQLRVWDRDRLFRDTARNWLIEHSAECRVIGDGGGGGSGGGRRGH